MSNKKLPLTMAKTSMPSKSWARRLAETVIPHEMKKEKTPMLIAFFGGILMLGCISNKNSIISSESNIHTSKTYLFLGNSFAEKFNSQIDTINFTWRDSFINNLLIFREYPKYHGEFRRIENYEYDKNNELRRTVVKTFFPRGETEDSTVYNKINSNITEVIKYRTGENPFKEIHRTSNDTLYVDQIINGEYGFTSREFWETELRKQRQIVKPKLDEVMNTFVYNENGDLIEIERHENGEFMNRTMSINYKYDSQNRIISKETYYGEGEKRELGSTEITIYE